MIGLYDGRWICKRCYMGEALPSDCGMYKKDYRYTNMQQKQRVIDEFPARQPEHSEIRKKLDRRYGDGPRPKEPSG